MKTESYSSKIMTFKFIFLNSFSWAKMVSFFFIFHPTFNWLIFYGHCAKCEFLEAFKWRTPAFNLLKFCKLHVLILGSVIIAEFGGN